jgi:glycosyltransferase involved in cell wall biosynthesis
MELPGGHVGRPLTPSSNTVREVLEDGVNGLLVDFFDTAALARQVVEVLAEPGRHAELGARARQHVREHYDLRTRCLPRALELIAGNSA